MRVTCKHCGRAHPSYECKYRDTKSVSGLTPDADRPLSRLPPKSASDDKSGRSQTKSTAALMEVQELEGSTTSSDGTKKRSGDTGNARLGDGLSEASKLAEISQSGSAGTQALPVDTNPPSEETGANLTRGVTLGETRPKFDKVAYQREYMRKWRASRVKPA